MAAFFVLGMTSCEKEDFNTKTDVDVNAPVVNIPGVTIPEGYKPGDAVVSIQPSVIAVINGDVINVTEEATITYNEKEKLEYTLEADRSIKEFAVNIVASYETEVNDSVFTLTAQKVVNVPTLSAGQVAIFTPTMVMSLNFNIEGDQPGGDQPGGDQPGGDQPGGDEPGGDQPGGDEPGGDEPGGDEPKEELVSLGFFMNNTNDVKFNDFKLTFENVTDYYYTGVTGTSEKEMPKGGFVSDVKIEDEYKNHAYIATLENIIKGLNQGKMEKIVIENMTLMAKSLTVYPICQIENEASYNVVEKFDIVTRAQTSKNVASFKVTDYSYIIGTPETNINLNGHGHGHGHGNGHGNISNAGGGIITSM